MINDKAGLHPVISAVVGLPQTKPETHRGRKRQMLTTTRLFNFG
jgi:hypothetical protein